MDAKMQQQATEGYEKIDPNQLTNLFPEHAKASSLSVFSQRGIKLSILNKLLFTFYQKESDECKDFHGVGDLLGNILSGDPVIQHLLYYGSSATMNNESKWVHIYAIKRVCYSV
jgi:hypothetical protein